MEPETRDRPVWMTILIGLSVVIAVLFVLYLVLTFFGIIIAAGA